MTEESLAHMEWGFKALASPHPPILENLAERLSHIFLVQGNADKKKLLRMSF